MNLNGLKIASNLNINESTWYFENAIDRFSMASKNNCFAHFKPTQRNEQVSPYKTKKLNAFDTAVSTHTG